ncbi:MAG: site-2 protease family protein [Candidatus Neomarinimicrobiota bacterium]|nr:MAG: site-2 protease family protein [Candidatus Neomarinimicrobiota bacterium]
MVDMLLLAPPILVALTFHEYAHGYVAFKLGDPTAKMAGRLTLNPLSHLDPIGTIMLFVVHFGWAKPVPVDPRYFRNPNKDMLWVAMAGPAANMVLAFISGILLSVMGRGVAFGSNHFLPIMLQYSLFINLALAVFNMLPIPPLDGSKVLRVLLPYQHQHIADQMEMYGPWVLMGLIMMGMVTGRSIFWSFIGPFVKFFSELFTFGLMS